MRVAVLICVNRCGIYACVHQAASAGELSGVLICGINWGTEDVWFG